MREDVQTGVIEQGMQSLTKIVAILGFQDITSFFLVSIFALFFLAFLIAGGIFLVKKRAERRAEIEKIVKEVQSEKIISAKKTELRTQEIPKIPEAKVQKKTQAPLPTAEPNVEIKSQVISENRTQNETAETKSVEQSEVVVENKAKDMGLVLRKTRQGFVQKLFSVFKGAQDLNEELLEEIEAVLFTADIGAKTAQKLMERLHKELAVKKISDNQDLIEILKNEMLEIFESVPDKRMSPEATNKPKVFLFVGVNGAGKTTSIGKLGYQLKNKGEKVLLGAGDTFRAAAVEQLAKWGDRIGVEVVRGAENSDPASVLFDAINAGKNKNADSVLCDTAGRLHTKIGLMEELKKVYRVSEKALGHPPHEVFLVVDATMGQNAILQAKEFAQAAPLTGIVMSKLDGTAKGGVALGIVDELKVPIKFIGVGEKDEDLEEFSPKKFVDALFKDFKGEKGETFKTEIRA